MPTTPYNHDVIILDFFKPPVKVILPSKPFKMLYIFPQRACHNLDLLLAPLVSGTPNIRKQCTFSKKIPTSCTNCVVWLIFEFFKSCLLHYFKNTKFGKMFHLDIKNIIKNIDQIYICIGFGLALLVNLFHEWVVIINQLIFENINILSDNERTKLFSIWSY